MQPAARTALRARALNRDYVRRFICNFIYTYVQIAFSIRNTFKFHDAAMCTYHLW